jgi:hypothetical protein
VLGALGPRPKSNLRPGLSRGIAANIAKVPDLFCDGVVTQGGNDFLFVSRSMDQ